jgi:hypothetical protein
MRTMSKSSSPLDSLSVGRSTPSHRCIQHWGTEPPWESSNSTIRVMETHECDTWKLTTGYRSARVMRPNLSAVLTASPRLVALSFPNML